MLYDLSSAAPMVRIGSLLVIGVTFYLGGWLYRKVQALEVTPSGGAAEST